MKSLSLIIISVLFLTSCVEINNVDEEVSKSTQPVPIKDDVEFIHSVFFWMNDSLSAEQLTEFEKGMSELLNIKSIVKGYYGPPAMTPRAVVDNTYDYAFVVHFDSKEGHDAYQIDSLHLNFIANYKTYWDSIRIYDNLVSDRKK